MLGECLAVLLACRGGPVADLTAQAIDEFDAALSASSIPPSSRRAYRARLASLRQLLYETRVVDTAPRRRKWARSLEQRFTDVAMAEPIRETLSALHPGARSGAAPKVGGIADQRPAAVRRIPHCPSPRDHQSEQA